MLQRFSNKYLALAALMLTAGLAAAWVWAALRLEQDALAGAQQRALLTSSLARENMRGAIRSIDLLLEMADQEIAAFGTDTEVTNQATARRLADLSVRLPELRSISLADKTGRLVYASGKSVEPTDIVTSDAFKVFRDGPGPLQIGELHGDSEDNRYFPVSRRLERGGNFSGILLATLNPAWFQHFGSKLGLPQGANVTIVKTNGATVASTDPAYRPFDTSLWQKLTGRLTSHSEFSAHLLEPANAADHTGEMLVGYQPLPEAGLVALYTVPYAVIMQDWSSRLWIGSILVALMIGLIAVGVVLLVFYSRRQVDLRHTLGLRTAEAAQSAERLALAVDTTGIGIFDYRVGDRRIAWDGTEAAYFGLRPASGLTPRTLLRAVHPADRPGLIKRLRMMGTARDDTRFDTEFRLRHPEFGAIWVAARAKLFVRSRNGRSGVGRLIGTLRDITERRLLQEHRETVLREINHRIKNSLQLMNSIMNLQSRRIPSVEERARFESARRRLISLATVYAHLDDTTQPDVVDLVPFLRRLCQDFSVAYMADGRITLSFEATGGTPLTATLAVPIGMAMGEILVSVSLNAFVGQTTGVVAVNVSVVGEQVEIKVSHNGGNLEQAFAGDGATLGRLLINAFVDQLGGTFSAENADPGVRFVIRFRAPPLPTVRAALPGVPAPAGN